MQSRALLFFAWLFAQQGTFALLENNCAALEVVASNITECQTLPPTQGSKATSLVQRGSTRGIGLSLSEAGAGFELPRRTAEPSFGLLFIQVLLLAALLGIVLLITNLVLRERHQYDANKDQPWTQTHTGLGNHPRANDEFKMPSRSAVGYGTPRTPPQVNSTLQHVRSESPGYQPLNRSLSLPAQRQYQRQYSAYGSPNVAARVPMLDLPQPKVTQLPVGLNLDDCPAWAALGTHSSMDSEDGTSFITSASNSRPSTMQRLQPVMSQPGTGPLQGQFYPTPPRPINEEGVSVFSEDGIDERPHPSHSFPPPMAPIMSGAMGASPDSARSDRLGAAVEEKGVVLQWYPQQSIGSAGWTNESLEPSPPGSSAWMTSRNEGPTAWVNTAPASHPEGPSDWQNTAPDPGSDDLPPLIPSGPGSRASSASPQVPASWANAPPGAPPASRSEGIRSSSATGARSDQPSAWANTAPHRTRSISPVPSSQRSPRGPPSLGGTPSFAPPPGEQKDEHESVAESGYTGSMAFVPHARNFGATLRAAQSFDAHGMERSASKSGFEKNVGGIVQWFNLATPRPPGFGEAATPSDVASMGGTPIRSIDMGSLPGGSPAVRRQPPKLPSLPAKLQ